MKKITGNRFKPFYNLSGLSGFDGLGDVSADIETLVASHPNSIETVLQQLEKEVRKNASIFTFDDNDTLYNRGITTEQKQAWVYYKRKHLGIPMNGGWKKYYLKGSKEQPFGTTDEVNNLVSNRALYYSDGNYLPYSIFGWGNIYERETQLLKDEAYITQQFGEAVYLDHLQVIRESKPAQLRFNDEDANKRAIISPLGTIAKTFKITELRPEFMKEVEGQDQIDNKGKRLKREKAVELDFDGTNRYKLRDVFKKWVYTLDRRRYFEKSNPFEVTNFYVDGYPISDAYKNDVSANAGEISQRAREEGEKLFQTFLLTCLTDEDAQRLNNSFNEKYNGWADLKVSSIPIGLETTAVFLNQAWVIKREKREAIAYMEAVGSGILAYDVGVGKTVSALLELANALHQGKCKRPLLVVPNPTYNNWIKEALGGTDRETGKEFNGLLSGLGYKINDWYNFNTKLVEKLDKTKSLEQAIEPGTITIITYEGLRKLGFSNKIDKDFINELKEVLDQSISDPSLNTGTELKGLGTARDDAKEEKKYEKIIGEMLKNSVCDVDTLGIDYIIIDEAHRCKNVFDGVKSDEEGKKSYLLTGQQSSTGVKAFFICNYIQRTYGRNVLLLTATPFTNSPLEVYSMLSLVAHDLLKETGYYNINDFFNQFAKVDIEYVVDIKGGVKTKEIIKGFNNRQILQKLIFTKINYKTGEDVGVKRPCKINLPMLTVKRNKKPLAGLGKAVSFKAEDLQKRGKYAADAPKQTAEKLTTNEQILTYLEMTSWQRDNQEAIYAMMEDALKGHGGKIDKAALFRAMSASLDNAFSPYLYKLGEKADAPNYLDFVNGSPKIKYACECVKSVKEWHEKRNEPVSGQVLYSNRGVAYFPLIKKYLIEECGYKEKVEYQGKMLSEVMMIIGSDGAEKVDKEIIKEAFNDGVVKVILGSATIREGINLQKNGTVLYDLYPDWNPTDVRQLEGRIWRQGNKFGFVRIVMPLVESSMDVFVFQKLEEKTSRINDLFYREGSSNVLDLDSIDPEQIKYALIRDVNKLATIDFSIEKSKAENAVQLLAEDAEAVKLLGDSMQELQNYRANMLKDTRDAVDKFGVYIQKLESEIKNETQTDQVKQLKQQLKYAINLKQDTEDALKQNLDEEYVKLQLRFENYNNRVGYYDTVPTWNIRYFVNTYRDIRKKEREILKPKGFSLNNNFKDISEGILKEFTQKNIEYKANYEATDGQQPKRYAEIYDEIVLKKQRMNIVGKSIADRVEEFKTLNYLLEYKATPTAVSVCTLPEPGEAIMPLTCPPLDETGKRRIDAQGQAMLRECIDSEPDTKTQNTDASGNYTASRQAFHDKIIAEVKGNKACRVQNQPIAILTGGAPGSGKSTFIKKYAGWMTSDRILTIDADAIRARLPEYKGWNSFNTHPETKDIVNQLLDEVGKPCEHDIIYDGTMNKATNYKPLIAKLKAMGYKVFIIYIQVPKEVSQQRALLRYQHSGRYVLPEIIDEVFDKGLDAYEELIKSVDGYIRVDGVTQQIIEKGGTQLPADRNYEFKEEISETVVTPTGKPASQKLLIYKYKAKAIAIKLKMGSSLQGMEIEKYSRKDLMKLSKSDLNNLIQQLENRKSDELKHGSLQRAVKMGDFIGKVIDVYMFRFEPEAYKNLNKVTLRGTKKRK